jgi:Tol biopolymer transport system component
MSVARSSRWLTIRRPCLSVPISLLLLLTACPTDVSITTADPTLSGSPQLGVYSPKFSPDGNWIVFVRDVDADNADIYVMRSDGSGVRRLADAGPLDLDPAFSPDGTTVVFDSDPSGAPGLFTVPFLGGQPKALTRPGSGFYDFPAWSPDGGHLVFGCGDPQVSGDLCVIRADGKGLHSIDPSADSREWEPAWSPDAKSIAFVSNRGGADHVYVMNVDGSNVRQLSKETSADPDWSPDGQMLAFRRDSPTPARLCLMSADGLPGKCLVIGAATPDWSPDGRSLVYYARDAQGSHIGVVSVEQGTTALLT